MTNVKYYQKPDGGYASVQTEDSEGNIIPFDDPAGWVKIASIPPVGPTENDLSIELERRLSLGFDFDFGDARGVHHFGTVAKDMERWTQEVTPLAQAATAKGEPSRQIGIKTETGPVAVSATEWWDILDAAGEWRQPIYQAYFALKSMDPIPPDYATNPAYWP